MKQSNSPILGACLMIAGTTTGAGMLALPMTSMSLGFINSVLLLVGAWALMAFVGLVSLEISLRLIDKNTGTAKNTHILAGQTFGRFGYFLSLFSLLVLFYSLVAAYISGSVMFVKWGVESALPLTCPPFMAAVCYTLVLGSCVYGCVKATDYANRFFFTLKVIVFVLMVYLLAPFTKMANLTNHCENFPLFSVAIPVFITSFGFQGCIAPLINYIGPNPRALRLVILVGSFLPLLIYIIWQAVTLGVLPYCAENASFSSVADFINKLNIATHSPSLSIMSNMFTFLAVTTSFLGVSMGLFDVLLEVLRGVSFQRGHRLLTAVMTFLPPLFFALFYPNGFIIALGYAAVALSLFGIIIPVAIAFKSRSQSFPVGIPNYQVAGGKLTLIIGFLGGCLVIACEVFNALQ